LLPIGREAYILKKDRIDENFYVISLVTLIKEYTISNDYLQPEWNEEIFASPDFSVLEPNATLGAPVCVENVCPFRISFLPDRFPANENLRTVAVIFFVLSLAALLLAVFSLLSIIRRRAPAWGFLFLLAVFIFIRGAMTAFQFPVGLIN